MVNLLIFLLPLQKVLCVGMVLLCVIYFSTALFSINTCVIVLDVEMFL